MKKIGIIGLVLFCFLAKTRSQTHADSVRFETFVTQVKKYAVDSPQFHADSSYYFATQALKFAQTTGNKFLIAQGYYYQGASLVNAPLSMANKAAGREELHKAARLFKEMNKKEWYLLAVKDLYILEGHFFDGKSEKSGLYQALAIEGRSDPDFQYPDNLRENEPDQPMTRATILRVIRSGERYIQQLKAQNNPESLMYAHEILGKYNHYYGDYSKSIPHFESAFYLSETTHNEWFSPIILNGLLPTLLNAKKYNDSEKWSKKGLELLQNLKIPELRRRFLDFMYQALKGQGRWNEAVNYKEKSYVLYDSLQDEAILKNGVYMQEKLGAERKQFIAEQQAHLQQQRLNYALFGAGVLLLVIVGLLWYNNTLRQTKQQLEAKNAEISAALLRGQTQERKRVASDLHDNLVAKIAGLRWRFQMIEKQELGSRNLKLYEDVGRGLEETLADVRMISHNLQPAQLEEKGLVAALQKMINDTNELGKTLFYLEIPDGLPRFTPNIEFELYTIALELTTNVLRHSKAKKAGVTLTLQSDMLSLIVLDDGIGMTSTSTTGMGMQNVRSRVERLRGTMYIVSTNGTQVEITIPSHALRRT